VCDAKEDEKKKDEKREKRRKTKELLGRTIYLF
jgi:hypothetical protein